MYTHFESLYPENSWQSQISRLFSYVKEGNSSQIIGLPGVGRANLLKILAYNSKVIEFQRKEHAKWFLFVLLDFSEIKNKPDELKKYMFLSILESLRFNQKTEEYKKVNRIFKQTFVPDELVLFDGLKRSLDYLCIEKEFTVVFLFDKFELFLKSISSDLFSDLAVLRSRAKYRFSVIFSLDRPLEDYFEPSFFGNLYPTLAGHIIYLPLSDKPSLDFRIDYIQKTTGKTLSKEILKHIFELTAGHGNYTRIAVEEILANETVILASDEGARPESENDSGQARVTLKDFLLNNRAIRSVSYEIWETLRASEQEILLNVIARSSATQNDEAIYLELVGLIKNNKITIPLFEDFVKYRTTHLINQRITFDPQTNLIKKGDFTISDHLTGLEFKLLKFLLEHEGIIVSREEVINGVWKELASTAGITEQALDQLIFRLRKKIEDDPNNPKYLVTIKGRGFRFNS